ncbi:hypothetical protein BsWGS_04796 [Bradybaena similaris]
MLLFIVQLLLCYSEVAADDQCPYQCNCTANEAKCLGLSESISGPFPDDVVNVTIAFSDLTKLEPKIFVRRTENIIIHDTSIDEISANTFANLHFLKSILFKRSFIQNIKTCSFSINSPAEIQFSESRINRLESSAISNMPQLERISIDHTHVDHIDSHAFFNIRVRELLITDTYIVNMSTASFSSVYQVQNFTLSMVHFNSVSAGAFTDVTDIQNVNIKDCKFRHLHCNALMALREATPGNHDTFVMSHSELNCDCLIVPMVEYILRHKNAVNDSVVCVESSSPKSLKLFQIPELCSPNVESCMFNEPLKSTCSSDATLNENSPNPNPFNKINKNDTWFNQHDTAVAMIMAFVLCIVLSILVICRLIFLCCRYYGRSRAAAAVKPPKSSSNKGANWIFKAPPQWGLDKVEGQSFTYARL